MVSIRQIAAHLCKELIYSIEKWNNIDYLITKFQYPNRDYVVLYNDSADGIDLSDRGTTLSQLQGEGVQLTASRLELVSAICENHGVHLRNSMLTRTAHSEDIGPAVIDLCHAITRIADIQLHVTPRTPSTLAADIELLLLDRIVPRRSFQQNWYHEQFDHYGHYLVDFRINGRGEARNLFHISSKPKADRVAAVCQFFKANETFTPTMAIVRPDLELGPHFEGRLAMSTSEVVYGVKHNEDTIIGFALSGI